MVDVALVRGIVRYDNIFSSLELVQDDFKDKISNSRHILIKPDLLHINGCNDSELSNADAVKAILDFVEEFTNKRITLAEGSFSDEDVFHRHGYHELLKDYSVKFVNLNYDDSVPIKVGKTTINVSKTLLKSDFRISAPVLKRDKKALLMGAIPNIVIGGISENDKADFYKSRAFMRSSAELFKLLKPQLSVIDGFDSVKTERKLKSSLALASADAVAADTVAARILKIENSYLKYYGKRRIKVV